MTTNVRTIEQASPGIWVRRCSTLDQVWSAVPGTATPRILDDVLGERSSLPEGSHLSIFEQGNCGDHDAPLRSLRFRYSGESKLLFLPLNPLLCLGATAVCIFCIVKENPRYSFQRLSSFVPFCWRASQTTLGALVVFSVFYLILCVRWRDLCIREVQLWVEFERRAYGKWNQVRI